MARYDYRCEQCAAVVEVVKSIKDSDTEEKCPKCAVPMVKQFPTNTSFSLKGTGWYATDYKKNRP